MEIFVFGSNLAGIHGKGAALTARQQHGAKLGVGEGLTGRSFALPTKDHKLKTRSLEDIKKSVNKFLDVAREAQNLRFIVTRVGCGLAGYTDQQIAPMFRGAPSNCVLPASWVVYFS